MLTGCIAQVNTDERLDRGGRQADGLRRVLEVGLDRRPRRLAALAAAAAALVLGVSACSSGTASGGSSGSSGSVKGRSLRVGAVFLDSQGFYGGVKAGFKTTASASGAKLKLVESNPGDDASKEASFVSTLVSSRVDALII